MRYGILSVVSIILLIAVGCGDEFATNDIEAVTNQNGETLAIAVSPDNLDIQAGGSISVMVQVTDANEDGVSGAAVMLSTTMGTLESADLTTDDDGYAMTTLAAGSQNGYAVLVATYKGIQAMVEVDFWSSSTEEAK